MKKLISYFLVALVFLAISADAKEKEKKGQQQVTVTSTGCVKTLFLRTFGIATY